MSGTDLPQKDSQHILLRAAEIDNDTGEAMSLHALRDAARQAGIAEQSFDRALQEHQRAQADLARRGVTRRKWFRRGAMAVGALVLIYGLLFLLPWSWNITPRGLAAPSSQSSPRPDSTAT